MGVRVVEDASVMALARERGAAFEVCVTSNYQTGVVPASAEHPLMKMIKNGINVTLCTDDPSISQITLTDEYHRVCEDMDTNPKQCSRHASWLLRRLRSCLSWNDRSLLMKLK